MKVFAASFMAVQVPAANIYAEPDEKAAIASQVIYGAAVEVLQNKPGWTLIKTDDDYQGWVTNNSLSKFAFSRKANFIKVANNFAYIYREANTTLHQPILLLPRDVKLPILKIKDERWINVGLAEGGSGWIQRGDVSINPQSLSMAEMLAMSKQLIGLPYLWGGNSTFGFDCSGFVQFLYRQMGFILPRDANQQVISPQLTEAAKDDLQPGDIMYFGWKNVISHAAIYLGDQKFINATAHKYPNVHINDFNDAYWKDIYITARRLDPNWHNLPKFQGSIEQLSYSLQEKTRTYTWHEGCPVPIEDLVCLHVSHWGFDNKPHTGALIVNKKYAQELLKIFQELYQARFPIEKMRPIEEYQGDDKLSMIDNNTSAFNCRAMTDFAKNYSIHSYGAAIDINPLINPYINGKKVEPKDGRQYADRSAYHKGKINENSPAYLIFTKYGWTWGGTFPGKIKDYQHFEKSS